MITAALDGKRADIVAASLKKVEILLLVAALVMVSACEKGKQSPSRDVAVATVNGEPIGLREYEKALAEETALTEGDGPLKPDELKSVKLEVLENTIYEKIMIQRAKKLLIDVGGAELSARIDDIRKDYGNDQFNSLFGEGEISFPEWKEALRKRMLLEKLVAIDVNAKVQVTDEEAQRYYKANRKTYLTARRVHVAQIVLPDRKRAGAVLKRLNAGEDFGNVAREVSIGPEAVRGGDLGFFERGTMPDAIDRVVFSLPLGKISRVVKSPYGYHLFKVIERAAAGGRRFSDVKDKVITDLKKHKEAEAYKVWIEGLKAEASIWIDPAVIRGE